MWVTADGRVRHELLPNGRYDEARGQRESAYRGRYTITGHHIDYVDDNGLGWILIVVGALAIVLALIVNAQRNRSTTRVERHVEE